MKLRINRAARAVTDGAEIWEFISDDSIDAADRLLDRLDSALDRLAEMPFIGRPRPDLGTGLRSLAVGNYVIYYVPTDSTVEVVRVLHGARDVDALFCGDTTDRQGKPAGRLQPTF